jgi:hypothetical protein
MNQQTSPVAMMAIVMRGYVSIGERDLLVGVRVASFAGCNKDCVSSSEVSDTIVARLISVLFSEDFLLHSVLA